jgi:hypothetical protein
MAACEVERKRELSFSLSFFLPLAFLLFASASLAVAEL